MMAELGPIIGRRSPAKVLQLQVKVPLHLPVQAQVSARVRRFQPTLILQVLLFATAAVQSQSQVVTGQNTNTVAIPYDYPGIFDPARDICLCNDTIDPYRNNSSINDNNNVLRVAGIFDTTGYDWSPTIFHVTMKLLNEGFWGPNHTDSFNNMDVATRTITGGSNTSVTPNWRLEYELMDAKCDEMTALRAYWTLFHPSTTSSSSSPVVASTSTLSATAPAAADEKRFHGIVGARCSGASIVVARLGGLEGIPQLSPTSNSALLGNRDEFPLFSRLTPPADETGQVGATIAVLRSFGWQRIGILATDTQFSKDLVNHLQKAWLGGNNSGEIAFSSLIRLTPDGSVDIEHAHQVLSGVEDGDNSLQNRARVVVLFAHEEDTFPILKVAMGSGYFEEETIWFGPSSAASKDVLDARDWLPEIPGFIEGTKYQNRDATYQAFLKEVQLYQSDNNMPVMTDLPPYAGDLSDAIRAMAAALVKSAKEGVDIIKGDGQAITRNLRRLQFDGVAGRVEFTPDGDIKIPQYTVLNAQSIDGNLIQWVDVGTTSTTPGSTNWTRGLASLCFAGVGCGLEVPPSDTFPLPPEVLPPWAIFFICLLAFITCSFLTIAWKYSRSKLLQKKIEDELNSFRESVVNMRTADCNYIPRILPPQHIDKDDNGTSKSLPRAGSGFFSVPSYLVNFKSQRAIPKLNARASVRDSLRQYVSSSIMINQGTNSNDSNEQHRDIAVGRRAPRELDQEPRMVMCQGDIIQISSQRIDGWAFGTKLFEVDEAASRQLVTLALLGVDPVDPQEGEVRVSIESGWIEIKKTRDPTESDLTLLYRAVGNREALEPPSHWDPMPNSSVVRKVELEARSPERIALETIFMATLPPDTIIAKVERVQNLALWQSYVVKRRQVYHRENGHFPSDDSNLVVQQNLLQLERSRLFHGCQEEVVDKILQQGFNRSFSGRNATLYGKGVYFARDSSYSSAEIYSTPDEEGLQCILACRVVVGAYCKGKPDAITPDVRDHTSHTLYDTTVDDMVDPSIFVSYTDAQAYPEYLITFKIPESVHSISGLQVNLGEGESARGELRPRVRQFEGESAGGELRPRVRQFEGEGESAEGELRSCGSEDVELRPGFHTIRQLESVREVRESAREVRETAPCSSSTTPKSNTAAPPLPSAEQAQPKGS